MLIALRLTMIRSLSKATQRSATNFPQEILTSIIVPVGGGGLISGISKGLCRNGHQANLIGAEPQMANDAARSLQSGEIVRNEHEPQTIADGARTISLGKHNWEIIKTGVSEIVEVSEEKIIEAVKLYFRSGKLKSRTDRRVEFGRDFGNIGKFQRQKNLRDRQRRKC